MGSNVSDMANWQPFWRGYAEYGDNVVIWVDHSDPSLTDTTHAQFAVSHPHAVTICPKGNEAKCPCGCGVRSFYGITLLYSGSDEFSARHAFLTAQERLLGR